MTLIHPINVARRELGEPLINITFPPFGWHYVEAWGDGFAFRRKDPKLAAIIDCALKDDGKYWVHLSISKLGWVPTHEDMTLAKRDFLGDRYAYAVYPPGDKYVNIHPRCLHLWSPAWGPDGRVLPEFSGELEGIGLSI